MKRITRRKFTPEEKIRIVLEGFQHEIPVRELCRREGIRPNVYYAWLKDFMEAGKEYHHKTKRPHELWATDCAHLRVMGWGWYYLVTVMDDFSTIPRPTGKSRGITARLRETLAFYHTTLLAPYRKRSGLLSATTTTSATTKP